MKIYTKNQVTNNALMYYMYDNEINKGISIINFSILSNLPCEITSCTDVSAYREGNIIIDELEFHEAYDKAIESLQNYVP